MGFLYFSNFNIRLIEKDAGNEFFSTDGTEVLRLMSDTDLFLKNPVCIYADPFLFEHNGKLFLFYEYQKGRYGKGELRMRSTYDLKQWSNETIVLQEPFHLSFPNVFEDGGNIYMIPETGADGSIRLYKATSDSLEHWEFVRSIIDDGRIWADSDMLVIDGKYYLFSSIYSKTSPEAHIFISDSIDGEFHEHPQSPFSKNLADARNAGRIFRYDGDLFRPVQDCSAGYGKQLSIVKIDTLTPTEYRETPYRTGIIDISEPFYKRGGHQFCPISFNGHTLVATDAKERNYNIPENINGYRHHLCKRSRP